MARSLYSSIEPLECRIAPATLSVLHPLPNIVAGIGKTGASIDLGNMFDPVNGTYDTMVTFTTNFDTAPDTPGIIQIELFDSLAPLTVQNFLSYINTTAGQGNFEDTFFSRLVAGFVLQGGGYTVANPSTHIAVGPPVHNEYNSANPIANTEGTVAMAKTGLSPNSATSEFFINLADNSSNLDNQNGGFTVFGQVTAASMTVVNDIAALPTADVSSTYQNSALTTVPYQGALPASGVPTASQFVEITNISVQAPTQGTSPGITFSSPTVTDAAGQHSSAITASITGQTLNLKYLPTASGVYTVNVTATDGNNNSVIEPFTVTVEPNLIANSVSDTLQDVIIPGDAGHFKVQLTNNGAATASGQVEVQVYLAPTTAGATTPATVGPGDLLIGDVVTKVNIASGASSFVSGNVKLAIPTLDELMANASDLQVIEQVAAPSSSGTTIASLFTDDKATDNGSAHTLYNAFGSFSLGTDSSGHAVDPRTNTSLTYVDASNHLVTLSYKGDGGGLLIPNGDGTVSLQTGDFGVEGNSSTSVLSLKIAPNGTSGAVNASTHTSFQDITLTNPVGNVALGKADITGNIDLEDGANTVTFGNLLGDGTGVNVLTFHLGASNAPATVQLGSVNDYSLTADSAVKSLKALAWTNDTTGSETISAPALTSLNITGDLEANVSIDAEVPAATATVKSFTVGGVLQNSTVQIGGNVGTVTLGAMNTSDFLVGTGETNGTPVIPAQRSDFSSIQTVGSFVIKGMPGASMASDMIASTVAAANFGLISVAGVDTTDEASPFGFIAETIARYQRGSTKLVNPAPGLYDAVGSYVVNVLAPTGAS